LVKKIKTQTVVESTPFLLKYKNPRKKTYFGKIAVLHFYKLVYVKKK